MGFLSMFTRCVGTVFLACTLLVPPNTGWALAPSSKIGEAESQLRERMKVIARTLADMIAAAGRDGCDSQQTRDRVEQAWEKARPLPVALRWNFKMSGDRQIQFYGLSLAGMDFVLGINPKTHQVVSVKSRRYPALLAMPAEVRESDRQRHQWMIQDKKLDQELSRWEAQPLAVCYPFLQRWAREIFTADEKNAGFLLPEYFRAISGLFRHLPKDVTPGNLRAICVIVNRALKYCTAPDKIHFLESFAPQLKALLAQQDGLPEIQRLALVQAHLLGSRLSAAAEALRLMSFPRGNLRPYLANARKVILEGPRRFHSPEYPPEHFQQALVFFTIACLGGMEDQSISAELVNRLYRRFEPRELATVQENLLANLLALMEGFEEGTTELLTALVLAATQRPPVDAAEFNEVLTQLVIVQQSREGSGILRKFAKNETWHQITKAIQAEFTRVEKMRSSTEPFPMPGLFLKWMAHLNESPDVMLGKIPCRLRVNLDNPLGYHAAVVSLSPAKVARGMDPALNLLALDYGTEFIAAPKGALGFVDIALAQVGGKTALVILERQPSSGYWRLISKSAQGRAYRQWLKMVIQRLAQTAASLPQIDTVIALSAQEAAALAEKAGENISGAVLNEYYGRDHFLEELGFVAEQASQENVLHFARNVAFGTNEFRGPFWVLDLRSRGVMATAMEGTQKISAEESALRQAAARAATFGERLRLVREARGFVGLVDLAKRMGVSRQDIRNWEVDGKIPRRRYLVALESALQFPLDLLFYGKARDLVPEELRIAGLERLENERRKALEVPKVPKPMPKEKLLALPWEKRFSQILRNIMIERGLTTEDVARVAKVSTVSVCYWLRGHLPQPHHVIFLAQGLKMQTQELVLARSLREDLLRDPETVGSRVKRARLANGWTQAVLAKKIGYKGREAIHAIEAGKRTGSLREKYWIQMAQEVGIELPLLRAGTLTPPRPADEVEADLIRGTDLLGGPGTDRAEMRGGLRAIEMKRQREQRAAISAGRTAAAPSHLPELTSEEATDMFYSLPGEISLLQKLDILVDNLSFPAFRGASAEALKNMMQAGVITRGDIVKPIPVDAIIADLEKGGWPAREGAARALRYLLEAGLVHRRNIHFSKEFLQKDRCKLGFDGLFAARALMHLSKAELVAKDDLGDVVDWKSFAKSPDPVHIEALQCLMEGGYLGPEEVGRELSLYAIHSRLKSADMEEVAVAAEELKELGKAGVLAHVRTKRGINLAGITNGLRGEAWGGVELWSLSALNQLVQAGFLSKGDRRIRTLWGLVYNRLRRAQTPEEFALCAETLHSFVQAGLVDETMLRRDAIRGDELSRAYRSEDRLQAKDAQGLGFLAQAGLIAPENPDIPYIVYRLAKDINSSHESFKDAKNCVIVSCAQALTAFATAKLIPKNAIEEPLVLDHLIANLGVTTGDLSLRTSEAMLALRQTRLVKRRDVHRISIAHLRRAVNLPETVMADQELGSYREYCLGIIWALPYSMPLWHRVGAYCRPDLLKALNLYALWVTPRAAWIYFCKQIRSGVAPDMLLRELENVLVGAVEHFKEPLDKSDFSVTYLDSFHLQLMSYLKDRTDLLQKISALKSIELRDGGNSVSYVDNLAKMFFMGAPPVEFCVPPVSPPVFEPQEAENIPRKHVTQLEELLEDAKLYKILGRTLVYKTPAGKYIALKFRKTSEVTLPNGGVKWDIEDPGKLLFESKYFDYMHALKTAGVPLECEYPRSQLIDGERVVRVTAQHLPTQMMNELDDFAKKAAKANTRNFVDVTDTCYTVMAYTTDSPDYFEYLPDVGDDRALDAFCRNIHDLGVLARFGEVNPEIIEMFHNLIQLGRADRGKYVLMTSIVRPMGSREGAGRMHAWEPTVAHPNNRVSGPADPTETTSVDNLMYFKSPHSEYLKNNLERFSVPVRKNILWAHYISNYLVALVLEEGKRRKNLGPEYLDWRKPEALAQFLQKVYSTAYRSVTGKEETVAKDVIDWTRFARQMAFFMSGAYRDYSDQDIPEEIFGLRGIRIQKGDGWGYLQKDFIEEKLGLDEVAKKAGELEKAIPYFVHAVSDRRQIGPDIYVFSPDFKKKIAKEKDEKLRAKLQALYDEYHNGWRFDGIHEDLGAVNGALPIPALEQANLIYGSRMVLEGPEAIAAKSSGLLDGMNGAQSYAESAA